MKKEKLGSLKRFFVNFLFYFNYSRIFEISKGANYKGQSYLVGLLGFLEPVNQILGKGETGNIIHYFPTALDKVAYKKLLQKIIDEGYKIFFMYQKIYRREYLK